MNAISTSKELEDGQEKHGSLLLWPLRGQPQALLVKATQRKKLSGKNVARSWDSDHAFQGKNRFRFIFPDVSPSWEIQVPTAIQQPFRYLVEGEYLSYK